MGQAYAHGWHWKDSGTSGRAVRRNASLTAISTV